MASNLATQLLLKGTPPAEIFTGADDQDPVIWLQNIDELFDAFKIDPTDRRHLLPMYFGGDAKKWYRSEEHSSEYDDFKQQLINAFTSSVHKLKISTKLMNRRQGSDESVQSYYYDVLSLCTRVNLHMQDDEKILYLLRGLKPSIKQHVIMSNPKNCKDLFEHARRAEEAASTSHPTSEESTISSDHPDETSAAVRRTTAGPNNIRSDKLHRNSAQRNTSPRRQGYNNDNQWRRSYPKKLPFQLRCYNCNGIGHYAYQCPSYLN